MKLYMQVSFTCLNDFFYISISIYLGNWKAIKDELKTMRNTSQLKDKWRNISVGVILDMAKQHGLVYRGKKLP